MADPKHVALIKSGRKAWNEWRAAHPDIKPDLSGLDLTGASVYWEEEEDGIHWQKVRAPESGYVPNLAGVDFSHTNLEACNLVGAALAGANFTGASLERAFAPKGDFRKSVMRDVSAAQIRLMSADLSEADLRGVSMHGAVFDLANLSGADMTEAYLYEASLGNCNAVGTRLSRATLIHADLTGANLKDAILVGGRLTQAKLIQADLTGADLSGAQLYQANLNKAKLTRATLTGAYVYGISAWDVTTEDAIQRDLVINTVDEPDIIVDDIEMAQFLNLLRRNKGLRRFIDTVSARVVLILGRFTDTRLAVLRAIRDECSRHGLIGVLFDFDRPAHRDLTETIATLAHLSRFIVVDITDARSVPQELSHIVPFLPSVPLQPVLEGSHEPYAMFEHFQRFPWVKPLVRYSDVSDLLDLLRTSLLADVVGKETAGS
jgi:uncharacterized protein YjbI with pentapeptide repeats